MKQFLIWTVLFVWLGSTGFSFGAGRLYSKAVRFAKTGQGHFAFMQYNNLLREYPDSKYRDQALFATGEYYYHVSNFQEAGAAFEMFLKENPESEVRLYALAYLLSMAGKNASAAEDLEHEIINLQQVSFIFRESKEVTYLSPLYYNYKVVIHIDKIEFYLEGKLFAKVAY